MATTIKTSAIVLLSGGLDSATTLAYAQHEGYTCYALTILYGQRHHAEIAAARACAEHAHVAAHKVLELDLRWQGGSALTDDIPVPKNRTNMTGIPVTYVPARNTLFLSLALGWAEVLNAPHIFIGVNAVDYSGYPDCRPAFIEAFEKTANLATRLGVEGTQITVHTPLMRMSKQDIIRTGTRLDVDYSLTLSCYDPDNDGRACGACDACVLRKKGFADAGIPDPTRYIS